MVIASSTASTIFCVSLISAIIAIINVDRVLMTNEEEKMVNFRVFLSEEDRTRFKVACAKNRTTMSQQAVQLIRDWVEIQENEPPPAKKKNKGDE
jgi:hypothetical protein